MRRIAAARLHRGIDAPPLIAVWKAPSIACMARALNGIDENVLRRVLGEHSEVEVAYVYGSYARGRPNRHSDLDVGVFVADRRLRRRLPATYEVDLGLAVGAATHHTRVEVAVLNTASPLLGWEAVRRGRCVFERSSRMRIAHETRVRQRYLDTAPLRAIQDRYLDELVRRGFSRAVSS